MPDMNQQDMDQRVMIRYVNHRGEESWRDIVPLTIVFMSTEWHPELQWILHALDLDKKAMRSFAMKDIKEWKPYTSVVEKEGEKPSTLGGFPVVTVKNDPMLSQLGVPKFGPPLAEEEVVDDS